MNNVIIKKYSPEYSEQLQELIINAENFGEPFVEYEFKVINTFHNAKDYGQVLLALDEQKNEVLGYCSLEISWGSLIIKSIAVHYKHLRKGIGTIIIDYIKNLGEKHQSINVVRVDTGDFMVYAQKFYLANGFFITGHVSHDLSWHNHQIHFSYPLKGNSIE